MPLNPANPASLIDAQADERINGLPILPVGTDRSTLTIPVYCPTTDKTHQASLVVGGDAVINSNAVVGGNKFVQYRDSRLYGVPANVLTLDRLASSTIVPGVFATVFNPADAPLTVTESAKRYVAAITTTGGVQVPRYIGAAPTDTVLIIWQEVVSADSFTVLLTNELSANKKDYAGLALRPLLIKLINELNTGSTVITQPADNTAPKAPTSGQVDDEANTFSGIAVSGFASYAEYEATGIPDTTGIVPLTAENSYQAGSRIYLKNLTGPIAKGLVGFRVASSGTRPAGAFLMNLEPFTGPVAEVGTLEILDVQGDDSLLLSAITAS